MARKDKVTIEGRNLLSDLSQDWGGVNNTQSNVNVYGTNVLPGREWGINRDEIERFLKEQLEKFGHRFGAASAITDESGTTTVRFFADTQAMYEWEEDPQSHTGLVLASYSFVGAGEASDYTLVARVVTPLSSVQVAGEENIFTFLYNSYWGSDASDVDAQPGSAVVTVNNTEVERISLQAQAGGREYSINIGQYITQEFNNVRIVVANAQGKSRTWDYRVEAKSLSIAFTDSYLNQQHMAKNAGWGLAVQVNGVGGTVHVSVDNGVLEYERAVAGGTQASFPIDGNGTLQRGTHTVEVWCEDTVYGLESNRLYTSYIVSSDSLAIAIGANATKEVTMYEAVLIPYYFFAPQDAVGDTVDVTIELIDNNGTVFQESSQSVLVDSNHSSGLQQAVVQIMNNEYIGKTLSLRVSVGSGPGVTSATHSFHMNSAGVTLIEADECKVHYNMAEKTNSDADVVSNAMASSYNGTQTSRLLRSDNFTLKNANGFLNGGFLIPPQKKLTLKDWRPFAYDFGVNGNQEGKTIEMEFASGTASDMEQPVISCMDARCGFEVYPTRIEVKYANSNSRIVTYFPDGERIKFSLVVNGSPTNCVNDDGNGKTSQQDRNLGFIYVNGVMVRIFDYANSSWQQQVEGQEIVFGSDECELMLYSIRGYDKALSMREVLGNFSYDTPLLADKIAIARRNNVLQSDGEDGVTISKTLLEEALPNTPIITWTMETLPSNKKDSQTCTQTDFTNPEWTEDMGHARAPFTAGPHEINGDGTSSNAYPLPYKNWAEKFKDAAGGSQGIITLHLTSGDETVKKYSITYGIAGAETKFVHKVNFASSEGIFNILAMNMYQQVTLAAYQSIPDLLSLQQQGQVYQGEDITFRKSLSGFPEIGFRIIPNEGQPILKFLSIYNFINNKKTGSMFGMVDDYKKNQLWEVDENVNFFNTPMTEHSVDGQGNLVLSNGVRNSSPFYYSRYPDESPVNMQPEDKHCDLGLPVNASQVPQANDEIRALRRVHNWIVSVNPNVAERYKASHGGAYRNLTVADDGYDSKTYGTTTFTQDTPQYRAQKFIDECDDYLHIYDCIFYFVFCTYILGMDSMDKNMSLFFDTVDEFYSDDPAVAAAAKVQLRIMLRDTDTMALFNNSGVLTYKYWHEWNDTYNPATGETGQITGETYNQETQEFSITTSVPGSSPVFNGRMSGLWDSICNAVPNQIQSVYQSMRSAGLNYSTFLEMYMKFRNYWCEALYNVDGLGYANTGYFTMAYGDKAEVAKYFFKYRERYMDSKYAMPQDTHQVTLRLSSVPFGIWMKHFTPIYASFSYGGNVPTIARSINVGEAALLPCVASSFNDATCYINDADFVTEIGTYTLLSNGTPVLNGWEGMQRFHFTFNFGRLIRLQKFIWANTNNSPNEEQTVENGEISFNNLKMLKELVMTYCTNWQGSPVIGSEIIEKIDFRGTPITNITLPETETLTELHLPATLTALRLVNLPNLETFTIAGVDNIGTLYVSNAGNIGWYMLQQIYAVYTGGNAVALSSVTLTGLNLTGGNKVDNMQAFNMLMWVAGLAGNTELSGDIELASNIHLTYEQKEMLVRAFGNIDSESNPLHITYSYNIQDIALAIFAEGMSDLVTKIDDYQLRAIPFIGETLATSANYISGTSWSLSNNPYATVDSDTGVMTVTSLGDSDNATAKLTLTATLLGGGTITSEMTLIFNGRAATLGDYVYADGSYSKNWIFYKTCVGVVFVDENGVKEVCMLGGIGRAPWGLNNSGSYVVSGVTTNGTTPAYDIGDLTNIANYDQFYVTDDNESYWNSDTDSFVSRPRGTADSDLTFTPSSDIQMSGLPKLEAGKTYPAGYRNTLLIINHRNTVLGYAGKDRPIKSANETESECLARLIDEITSAEGSSQYSGQYYYPAASYCYAYQPNVKSYEILNEKFEAHKWYLPSAGSLSRIMFYRYRNDVSGTSKHDAFKDAKSAGRMSFDDRAEWSSTEYSASVAWSVVDFTRKEADGLGNNKGAQRYFRAVCAL